MDVKGAFDHVSKTKLVERMMELGDLIRWTLSFLTDRKIQLVIDGHTNRERDIETGIPQGSPVSPILFLVYISGVFEKVSVSYPAITSLSFVDDLGFIASGYSVKELAKTLGQVATVVTHKKKTRQGFFFHGSIDCKLKLFDYADTPSQATEAPESAAKESAPKEPAVRESDACHTKL